MYRVENMTTKKVVVYFIALTKCGKVSLVSRYRLRHWAKRIYAGIQATIGRMNHVLSTHLL